MADVAQLVRALVCGTRCRQFESDHPPQISKAPLRVLFFLISEGGGRCELTGVSLTTSESETRVSRSA